MSAVEMVAKLKASSNFLNRQITRGAAVESLRQMMEAQTKQYVAMVRVLGNMDEIQSEQLESAYTEGPWPEDLKLQFLAEIGARLATPVTTKGRKQQHLLNFEQFATQEVVDMLDGHDDVYSKVRKLAAYAHDKLGIAVASEKTCGSMAAILAYRGLRNKNPADATLRNLKDSIQDAIQYLDKHAPTNLPHVVQYPSDWRALPDSIRAAAFADGGPIRLDSEREISMIASRKFLRSTSKSVQLERQATKALTSPVGGGGGGGNGGGVWCNAGRFQLEQGGGGGGGGAWADDHGTAIEMLSGSQQRQSFMQWQMEQFQAFQSRKSLSDGDRESAMPSPSGVRRHGGRPMMALDYGQDYSEQDRRNDKRRDAPSPADANAATLGGTGGLPAGRSPLDELKENMLALGVDIDAPSSKRGRPKKATGKVSGRVKALKAAAKAAVGGAKKKAKAAEESAPESADDEDDDDDDGSDEGSDEESCASVVKPKAKAAAKAKGKAKGKGKGKKAVEMKRPAAAARPAAGGKRPPMPTGGKASGPQTTFYRNSKVTVSYPKGGFRVFLDISVSNPVDKLIKWDRFPTRAAAWKAALDMIEAEA